MWLFRRMFRWLSLIAGAAGVGYLTAWLGARKQAKINRLEDYQKTRKDVDDGDAEFDEIVGDDPDAARRWLRERKP